ncbi:pirin family protein [Robiginitalea sp. IMCC43444]|uniref:pirin family protein n=1 Tax=Robiginitalea sp. IMCC43444 TaxID=3459121 RepID=UPI0040436BFF
MSENVKQIFPLGFPWDTPDPFLFCVHHLDLYPRANEAMGPDADLSGRNLGNDFTIKDGWRMYHGHTIPGFPSHPHRGFETITIVTKGFCDHSDSLGAAARFGQGDVQWMTAGRGVQHSEMFPLLNQEGPNTFELFQIWLNLPAEKKLVEPHFKILWNDMLPKIDVAGVSITLIAGQLDNTTAPEPPPDSWAADPDNDVQIALIDMEAGAAYELPQAKEGSNRRLYLFEGTRVRLADTRLAKGQGAVLGSAPVSVQNTGEACRFLLLQGKPISEPVAKYGPFVMNTQEEINRSIQEYQLTQFGGWPWPHPDHAHPKEKGRFARYPDGTLVEK